MSPQRWGIVGTGKHVLLEKAFTTTAAEARELAALAAEQGRFLMEAMWMRFDPTIRRLLDEVRGGAIGEVRTVQASLGFPPPPDAIHWRRDLGGGALLDMGVYPLTFAQLLLGEPVTIEATGELREDGLDLTASVHLRYDDGRFAALLTSLRSFISSAGSVGGSDGLICVGPLFLAPESFTVVRPPSGEPRTVGEPREGRGYVPMFRAVGQAIADGLLEHPDRPLRDTIAVLEVLDEVRRRLGPR